MTINEMLLLDVGSEDEKIEYYKKKVEEDRLRNPPPKVEVLPEDLDPSLRFRRMLSQSSQDPNSNFRSSQEIPRDNLHNDLHVFDDYDAGGAPFHQSFNRHDLDLFENTGFNGSYPGEGGFNTMKSNETRHVFSKISSPRQEGYGHGERASTVLNESVVYYDGTRLDSYGTNTQRFNPG